MRLLIGTYTDLSESQGLYLYSFSPETGESRLVDALSLGNPSFVVPSPDGRTAWAVSEYDDSRACLAEVALPSVRTGRMKVLSRRATGAGSCHILLAPPFVMTADFAAGSLTAHRLAAAASAAVWRFVPPVAARPSRMHMVVASPDGRYVFATDLGQDCLWRFRPTVDDPFAEAQTVWEWDAARHPGPRQLLFGPDGRQLFLLHEKSDELQVFSYDAGCLTLRQTLLAYRGGGHGSGALALHPNGRFLYTSHRLLSDGISLFRLASPGSPEPLEQPAGGFFPTGAHPRHFAITPDGRWLLCACRDANQVECYGLDPETGRLSALRSRIAVPKPVCVQIVG